MATLHLSITNTRLLAKAALSLSRSRYDPLLRGYIRWALERLYADLTRVGQRDVIASSLAELARRLLAILTQVAPLRPSSSHLKRWIHTSLINDTVFRGLEALACRRGARARRHASLMASPGRYHSAILEAYVEGVIRREAASKGEVRVARLGDYYPARLVGSGTSLPNSFSSRHHRTPRAFNSSLMLATKPI